MNDIFGQPVQSPSTGCRPDPKDPKPNPTMCASERGTIIKVYIAPGTTISLFGLFEVTSPSGICLLVNLPFINGKHDKSDLLNIFESIKKAGGSVEFVNQ